VANDFGCAARELAHLIFVVLGWCRLEQGLHELHNVSSGLWRVAVVLKHVGRDQQVMHHAVLEVCEVEVQGLVKFFFAIWEVAVLAHGFLKVVYAPPTIHCQCFAQHRPKFFRVRQRAG
jgi:hypothetical protein